MHVATDREYVPASGRAERYVTVTITAPEVAPRTERPPMSAALVVDRSGSMTGRKLDLAKVAAERAVAQLSSRDHVSLVAYDHEVLVLAECASATPPAKADATDRLRALEARGNTDLAAGWEAGCQQAALAPEASRRRVMLLSDGLTNAGETNPATLAAQARRRYAEGCATSTFGIGEDFDEQLLASMALEGGGHFYYIERPEQILDLLASEFGEALDVSVRDVQLSVHFPIDVDVEPITAYRMTHRLTETEITLGDMTSGQQITVVLAVRFNERSRLPFRIELGLRDREGKFFAGRMKVTWVAWHARHEPTQPVNETVLVTVAEAIAARARSEALEQNRRRDFLGARETLWAAIRRIESMGRAPGLRQIARRLRDESDELASEISMLRRKGLHFESHAMLASRASDGRARQRS